VGKTVSGKRNSEGQVPAAWGKWKEVRNRKPIAGNNMSHVELERWQGPGLGFQTLVRMMGFIAFERI
jgi:hypothetical protein